VIDQDQMTLEELKAIVETTHAAGRNVTMYAHRVEEIRQGIRAGADCFEHTGLPVLALRAAPAPSKKQYERTETTGMPHWNLRRVAGNIAGIQHRPRLKGGPG
jgi:imidazolonepropionase-like amidohydrolase